MGYVHKAYTKDRPDGIEFLGNATINIMEQGSMYCDAHVTDWGQRIPTKRYDDTIEYPNPNEVRYGQGITTDVQHIHYARHRESISKHLRSYKEEYDRKERLKEKRRIRRAKKRNGRL
jgi:hypothetical protein